MIKYRKAALLRNQQGSFLASALIMIMLLVAIGLSLSELIASQYGKTKHEMYAANGIQLAEAGVEESVHQLNLNASFTGYATPQVFFNNSTQGRGTFETTITDSADGKSKTIVSTGKVYHQNDSSNPYVTRKVRVTVVGTSNGGSSIQTGPGGLIMNGLGTINNTPVSVGGSISMNGLAQIGTGSDPLEVNVGHNNCPSGGGATYPQVCNDGSQPIDMNGLLGLSHIYGTVCATGQTDSSGITGGSSGEGLKVGCIAPVSSPPTYDRQAQINAVTTTGSPSSYKCSGLNNHKDWPANLKITGDMTINGLCNVTIHGNVYIAGDLTINGFGSMKVDDSVGTNRPVIIVDGKITVTGLGSMQANSSGTGIEFISFKNSTGNPGANVTGNDLYNSQSQQTVNVNGVSAMPGMIFYSYWGKVTAGGINFLGALAGQTVDLEGIGTVIFGTQLNSGSKTWAITSYQQLYN